MSQSTENNRIALRYVNALLDQASEDKKFAAVAKDIADLEETLAASEEFQAFATNPLITRDDKINVCAAMAKKAKFQPLTESFLCLLAKNGRLSILRAVLSVAKREIAHREGVVTAEVTSAYTLSAAQTKELQESLKKGLGKDVKLVIDEDKDLLGGMTIKIGSRLIDDSVKTKLDRLTRTMADGQNNIQQEEVA